ncbi:MAG: GNAT family N-acetyltransferase [Cyclobacteriaceae bacterium]
MKSVIEGPIPEGFRTAFEVSLFNTEQHRAIQSLSGWHSFYLVNDEKRLILASIHFFVKDQLAVSPLHAPFGSFEWSDELEPSELYQFMLEIEPLLRAKGVCRIEIKHPPIYEPRQHLVPVFLNNMGYQITNSEMGALIPVTEQKLEKRLHAWPGRKWKQSKQIGLVFKKLSLHEVETVYDFILAARDERGYGLSMSKHDVVKTATQCKKYFHLFGIYHDSELVAACISIKVTSQLLYNFYLAHSRATDKISPVVALLNGIYAWCQEQGFAWVDLGTSAINQQPNFPLLEFKLRMGALPVSKFTFSKKLE